MSDSNQTIDEKLGQLHVDDIDDDEATVRPDLTVISFGDEKQIGFEGVKHLDLAEERKERIHTVYSDIIIQIDEISTQYNDPERLWQLGKLLNDNNVIDNDDMTITELGNLAPPNDIDGPKIGSARHLYAFWPDKNYDSSHSPVALGKLASRAITTDRLTEAQQGYRRLVNAELPLTDTDVLVWNTLSSTATAEEIIKTACEQYDTPTAVANCLQRVWLLTDRPIAELDTDRAENMILDTF